jgi:hypothetical protein
MATNELKILPANFNDGIDKFFLDDPIVLIKILDDTNWTAFKTLGVMEIDKNFSVENEYAEFKTGIPQRTKAKDVISTKTFFEGKIKSVQPETVALLTNSIIESGSTQTKVFMGSEIPTQVFIAIILQGETHDGKQVELRIRKAVLASDSVKIGLGGKDYASLDFKAEVLVDEDPLVSNFDWDVLGEIETTADTTADSKDITVTAATGIVKGQLVYGAGIPVGSVVSDIANLVVTLSEKATATAVDAKVKFVTAENILKSDVVYWIFEA